jgi:hypothetical protein
MAQRVEHDDLTAKQNDYAIFLPALSSFYATFIGKQRVANDYVEPTRMPTKLPEMENFNWFNTTKGVFTYKWSLYSAGHANLDVNVDSPKEDMVRKREPGAWVLGDSGGFQIGKGVWEGDWKNPACPKAKKKREQVLAWMDAYMDYGMILDIPAWVCRSPEGRKATNINSYEEAVQGTYINNDYFINNRTGACKFLNVLQGENHQEAEDWYQRMKKYCDPAQYPTNHFNGWSMGGQNMCDIHLILHRLVTIIDDGLLEEGVQDWMHFLGTSKLEWATLLTDIQRSIRKHHNPKFTISFDCASPFLATANGQIYTDVETPDRGKWTYRMQPTADNKKYSTDTRQFSQGVLADGYHTSFKDSPISRNLEMKDICIYAPGDLNKNGKEGKTSWDSFSYAIMMGHNVWQHLNAVQEANRQYDAGHYPKMLIQETFDTVSFRDVCEAIFSADTKEESMAIIGHYSKFWMSIIGTRGATGKKTVNAGTMFNNLFDVSDQNEEVVEETLDEAKLDKLEMEEV